MIGSFQQTKTYCKATLEDKRYYKQCFYQYKIFNIVFIQWWSGFKFKNMFFDFILDNRRKKIESLIWQFLFKLSQLSFFLSILKILFSTFLPTFIKKLINSFEVLISSFKIVLLRSLFNCSNDQLILIRLSSYFINHIPYLLRIILIFTE